MPAKALHRQALVETAMRLFRRQGYASTGLNQILAESSAPKGSLYYYFPGGKEALAVEAVTLAGTLMADMLQELAAASGDADDFVQRYAQTMAGWMEESAFSSGCPIATTMLETAPGSASLSAVGKTALANWIEIIGSVYRRQGCDAEYADQAARDLVCAMQGALILARVWRSAEPILDVARRRAGSDTRREPVQ